MDKLRTRILIENARPKTQGVELKNKKNQHTSCAEFTISSLGGDKLSVTPPREPPTKPKYIRTARLSTVSKRRGLMERREGLKTERKLMQSSMYQRKEDKKKIDTVKNKIEEIYNKYLSPDKSHISEQEVKESTTLLELPGFKQALHASQMHRGILSPVRKSKFVGGGRSKSIETVPSPNELRKKTEKFIEKNEEKEAAYKTLLNRFQRKKLGYQELWGRSYKFIQLFKNVKTGIIQIDNQILSSNNDILNLPLLWEIEGIMQHYEKQQPKGLSAPLGVKKDFSIELQLHLVGPNQIKITINNSDGVKVNLSTSGKPVKLEYNSYKNKLIEKTPAQELLKTPAQELLETPDTLKIHTEFDTFHSRNDQQECVKSEILPPSTPTFHAVKEIPTELLKPVDMLNSELDNIFKKAFDYDFYLRATQQNQLGSQQLEIMRDFLRKIFIEDIRQSEEIEKEIDDIMEREILQKDLAYTNKDNVKFGLRRLWDNYTKVWNKMNRFFPHSSRVLHRIVRGIVIFVDKALRESKGYVIKVQNELKKVRTYEEERRLLEEKLKQLEEEKKLFKFEQELNEKIVENKNENEKFVSKQIARDMSKISTRLNELNHTFHSHQNLGFHLRVSKLWGYNNHSQYKYS